LASTGDGYGARRPLVAGVVDEIPDREGCQRLGRIRPQPRPQQRRVRQGRVEPFRVVPRVELIAFVESSWPLMEADPCPSRWCGEFLEAMADFPTQEGPR
jgi:hypothetical protein